MIKFNAIQKKRLMMVFLAMTVISSITALVLYGLKKSINLYVTPSELLADVRRQTERVHLGGMVKEHSVVRSTHDLRVTFQVTDFKRSIPVVYHGIVPDLFREGKGVVMQGRLDVQGVFQAEEILAKHDENYVPVSMKKRPT